jgi:hypothetical protein
MTVQRPFEQAHPLQVAPLLRQLQRDGVVHRSAPRWATGRGWLPAMRRCVVYWPWSGWPVPILTRPGLPAWGAMQNRKTLPESALAAAVVAVAARGGWQRPSRAGLA